MNNSNSIDYNTKVMDFLAMTETGDPEVATKYLQSSNWDVTLAVNQFFNKINVNINNNIPRDEINVNTNNILNRNLINNNTPNKSNNNNDVQQNEGFLSKYIFSPLKAILGVCLEKREVEKDEEERIFHLIPNKVQNLNRFYQSIRRKIGIIMIYTANDVQFLSTFFNQLSHNTSIINLLKQNFSVYPLLANTNEGYTIQNMISENQLIYPSFVFCFNNSNNQTGDYMDNYLDREHIIEILEGENITLDSFNNTLIECKEKIISQFENNFGHISDGEILEQQKSDMEALEKQVQKKEEELKKKKLLEQQRIIEEEKKLNEIENKAKEAKAKIVEEPSEDNPDVTTICFRYPDGEKRKDRRFLKSHTIQNLYDYVTSLGKEIYTEEDNNSFSLYQPFPPKKYEEMDNTLEKEGLFPNAVIQIREE